MLQSMQLAFIVFQSRLHRDVLRHGRSLHDLRGLLRALSLGFIPRVLWHMHLLGVLLSMSLLFREPAPFLYTYAFYMMLLVFYVSVLVLV